MAIGRLSVKVGKTGRAGPHAAYIAREGAYAHRIEHGEKLEATGAGNMPAWAQSNPSEFWLAADANERVNGSTYREMEIALPRELGASQRIALVIEFVSQEIGDRHAYQWAIHTPKAVDGGEQPHVHLMFSERQRDDVERDPEQYFRRYNAKSPEKGGARKGYGPSAGQTLSKLERTAELKALRERWESMCNRHLEHAGHEARIDMRSHAERGTGLDPERKQLPSQWRSEGRSNVIQFRRARAEHAQAQREVALLVPDVSAAIVDLAAERRRREEQKRVVEEKAQAVARIEAMTSAELQAEIERLRPPPLEALVHADERVAFATARLEVAQREFDQAGQKVEQVALGTAAWRNAHPVRAKMHDMGVPAPYLVEQAKTALEAAIAREDARRALVAIQARAHRAEHEARDRLEIETLPAREEVNRLESFMAPKLRREHDAWVANASTRKYMQQFETLAVTQRLKTGGHEASWASVPDPLRSIIERYNQISNEQERRRTLARMFEEPAMRKVVEPLLEQQKRARELSRGRGGPEISL